MDIRGCINNLFMIFLKKAVLVFSVDSPSLFKNNNRNLNVFGNIILGVPQKKSFSEYNEHDYKLH